MYIFIDPYTVKPSDIYKSEVTNYDNEQYKTYSKSNTINDSNNNNNNKEVEVVSVEDIIQRSTLINPILNTTTASNPDSLSIKEIVDNKNANEFIQLLSDSRNSFLENIQQNRKEYSLPINVREIIKYRLRKKRMLSKLIVGLEAMYKVYILYLYMYINVHIFILYTYKHIFIYVYINIYL